MNDNLRRHRAVLKGDVRTLRREKLDSYVLKSAPLDRHVFHFLKLVLTHWVKVNLKGPYSTDVTIANELWSYQVTVQDDRFYHYGRRSTRNFAKPNSQFVVGPRSIGCASFIVKSASVFYSYMSREELLNRVTYKLY